MEVSEAVQSTASPLPLQQHQQQTMQCVQIQMETKDIKSYPFYGKKDEYGRHQMWSEVKLQLLCSSAKRTRITASSSGEGQAIHQRFISLWTTLLNKSITESILHQERIQRFFFFFSPTHKYSACITWIFSGVCAFQVVEAVCVPHFLIICTNICSVIVV